MENPKKLYFLGKLQSHENLSENKKLKCLKTSKLDFHNGSFLFF